ncbi:M23 family metallopeptidase [uncultured Sulfitobacter sp.]|uniref:M23 family metallopeptidase n=1 Tax=uncultured Sulfitobacter sp. TaxID=191468 RepID=UPI0030DA5E9E|tara:strand:- start:110943 stop:111914 length:972 start_codon:yes stop_codon:yes gene_type:complete
MRLTGAALSLALAFASPALAEAFLLSSAIDCDLASDCYIQQYVDSDPSPATSDFTCSTLSYDGHKGTDFALPNRSEIARNVRVLASAAGRVKGVRDGMADVSYSKETADEVAGRECGNGVVIEHGDGWETQYCHLKQGSVVVKPGQKIWRGQEIGFVGQSGKAAFPHVHLSVRKDGKVIDPFDPDGVTNCAAAGDSTLWKVRPDYRPGGLIGAGFAPEIPEFDDIKAGSAAVQTLPANAPALVIWGYLFGSQPDDTLTLSINGLQGVVIADDVTLTKAQAQSFRAIGKKRRGKLWPAGRYSGVVTLTRGLEILGQKNIHIEVR